MKDSLRRAWPSAASIAAAIILSAVDCLCRGLSVPPAGGVVMRKAEQHERVFASNRPDVGSAMVLLLEKDGRRCPILAVAVVCFL